MVVAFNFKRHCEAITNVYDACIFPWALQNPGAFDRKFSQIRTGTFVTAMLAPHDRKNTQLCHVRGAAYQVENTSEFFHG